MKNKSNGYTLVEILVVISIMGFLWSIVWGTVSITKANARDIQRLTNLEQFSSALNQYYLAHRVFPCGDYYRAEKDINGKDIKDFSKGIWVDGSVSCPFLEGIDTQFQTPPVPLCPDPGHDDYSESTGSGACKDPNWGLFNEKVYPIFHPKDPFNEGDYRYSYYATMDRQKFIIRARLERYTSLMQNDGGWCDDIYEIGNGKSDPYIQFIHTQMAPSTGGCW